MILGLLIIGCGVGLFCFFLALILGHSLLFALLMYSAAGCLTVMTIALLLTVQQLPLIQFAVSRLRQMRTRPRATSEKLILMAARGWHPLQPRVRHLGRGPSDRVERAP